MAHYDDRNHCAAAARGAGLVDVESAALKLLHRVGISGRYFDFGGHCVYHTGRFTRPHAVDVLRPTLHLGGTSAVELLGSQNLASAQWHAGIHCDQRGARVLF